MKYPENIWRKVQNINVIKGDIKFCVPWYPAFLWTKYLIYFSATHSFVYSYRGGGGTSICMHIGYVPRERPPIFSPEFLFRSISFSQITILHFLADFAVPETIIFKISLSSTRSSPPTAGSARTQSVRQRRGLATVPEIRIFRLKTAQARSGAPHFQARSRAPHFHARPGARSGAVAHCSLCPGTYLPTFGVSTPPPPPGFISTVQEMFCWKLRNFITVTSNLPY